MPDQSAETCRGSLRTPQRCAGWGGPSAAGGRREEDERLWGPAARPVGRRASRTAPCPRWETSCARSVKPTMPLYDSFFLLFLVRPFLFSFSVSLSLSLSGSLSLSLWICVSVSLPVLALSRSLFVCLSLPVSVCLSVSHCLCLSLSVSVSVSLPVSPPPLSLPPPLRPLPP